MVTHIYLPFRNIQLKRAYHKLALKAHPDKGGSPEKFQELGHAYQVLSNERKSAVLRECASSASYL